MMYACKIIVNNNKKKINKTVKKEIDDSWVNIKQLRNLGISDNTDFSILEDNGRFFISYSVVRYETDNELKKRVNKEINYNKNYDLFHSKYKR